MRRTVDGNGGYLVYGAPLIARKTAARAFAEGLAAPTMLFSDPARYHLPVEGFAPAAAFAAAGRFIAQAMRSPKQA